jgi:hypothetical protein
MKFLISILLLALLVCGCDLFETREAELPDQPRSNFQSAVTPQILIQNLIYSLQDKNVENYLACFSDPSFTDMDYKFSPSSGASSQFPSLASDWSRNDEEQYFNNMKSKIPDNLPVTLILSNTVSSPQGDSLLYSASYSLNVPHNDANIPRDYQGDLQFSMIRDSRSVWAIYYWQDSKNSDLPSWSELKGRFY